MATVVYSARALSHLERAFEFLAKESPDAAIAAARVEEATVAGNIIARLLIEQRLTQLGEDPGTVDGTFDEATRRALRRFQRARDLPVTGYVTQATMARLLAP